MSAQAFLTLVVLAGTSSGAWSSQDSLHDAEATFVREVGPLDPAVYASKEVLDDENAAVAIRAALERLPDAPDASRGSPIHGCVVDGPPSEGAALVALRGDLLAFVRAMDEVRRAQGRNRSRWGIAYSEPQVETTDRLDELVYGLACDARLAILDGDAPRAIDRMRSLAAIRGALLQESTLARVLLGIATETLEAAVLRDSAASPNLSRRDLETLTGLIPGDDPTGSLARAWAWESALCYDGVRRTGRPPYGEPDRGLLDTARSWFEWPWYRTRWKELYLRTALEVHHAIVSHDPQFESRARSSLYGWPPWAWRLAFPFTDAFAATERIRANATQREMARRAFAARLRGTRAECRDACDPFARGSLVWEDDRTLAATAAASRIEKAPIGLFTAAAWVWRIPGDPQGADKPASPARLPQ